MTLPVAPSPNNYFIGKGIATIKRDGQTTFKDMGNCPEFEFSPKTDTLDHFSSREGVKTKDKTVVVSKGGELRILMEENTPENLGLLICGSVDYSNPASPKVNIFDLNATGAEVRFYATNEVGPKWDGVFPGVDFLPSGSFQPISNEWGQLEITGEIRTVDSSFGYWQLRDPANVAPFNIAEPVITAEDGLTVGDVLTASTGTWLNKSGIVYTYQWNRNGVAIGGATNATHTIIAPDVHALITVVVTGTSTNGSDVATSAAVTPEAYT
jgi:hypothetical protein